MLSRLVRGDAGFRLGVVRVGWPGNAPSGMQFTVSAWVLASVRQLSREQLRSINLELSLTRGIRLFN